LDRETNRKGEEYADGAYGTEFQSPAATDFQPDYSPIETKK